MVYYFSSVTSDILFNSVMPGGFALKF